MDLEHPPQPPFATPTSLLKKEPPGYEETVTQQPKQQVRMPEAGVLQARLRHFPDNQSLSLRTQMVEGENWFLQTVFF